MCLTRPSILGRNDLYSAEEYRNLVVIKSAMRRWKAAQLSIHVCALSISRFISFYDYFDLAHGKAARISIC